MTSLSVSDLKEHHVPIFVVEQWAKRATSIKEWMALLQRNTAKKGSN
jgi:hypothetical protein